MEGKRRYVIIIPVMLLLSILLFGLSKNFSGNHEIPTESMTDFALDTVITITIYEPDEHAKELLAECKEICSQYEKIFSRTREGGEVNEINARVEEGSQLTFTVSEELSALLDRALFYAKESDGAFEPSIEPITSLWNFKAENPIRPDDGAIKKALTKVSYKELTLEGQTLTFAKKGMGLDLGGIAKGYIADRIGDYLLSQGVKSAVISLGGNVLCVGEKQKDVPFKIGVQMPFGEYQETVAILSCKDCSIVTSGIYERCFTQDGEFYHHLLNPKSGYPWDNDLLGVTIVSEKSVDGDALSTSCFAMGLEEGMAYIDSLADTYALFITKDKKLHYSKGMEQLIVEEQEE